MAKLVRRMSEKHLDILAFGAHADDVEIGMGATIAKYAAAGRKIGICDLTKAELSSNGTVEIRQTEANKAGALLGICVRETLDLPDRGLLLEQQYIKQAAAMIRKYRPEIVFAPYHEDRHPDHGNCARIIEEAVFSAGIMKYETDGNLPPHRPKQLYYYMINGFHQPDFVIDVTDYIHKKIESLQCYESQFIKTESSVDTPLVNGYIEMVEAREGLFGKQAGVKYAEGFKAKKPLLIENDLLGDRK